MILSSDLAVKFRQVLRLAFTFLLFLAANSCIAQEGTVAIIQDSSISRVLALYKTFATEKRQISGYRVQLASGNNRQTLMEVKARFLQKYPEVDAYLEYMAPQFKLRVGDFRSRAEAEQFLADVRKSFSAAFVVPDKVMVEGVVW